jgi:hypothetical protein
MQRELEITFIALAVIFGISVTIAAIVLGVILYVPHGEAIMFGLVFGGGPIFLGAVAAYGDMRRRRAKQKE